MAASLRVLHTTSCKFCLEIPEVIFTMAWFDCSSWETLGVSVILMQPWQLGPSQQRMSLLQSPKLSWIVSRH